VESRGGTSETQGDQRENPSKSILAKLEELDPVRQSGRRTKGVYKFAIFQAVNGSSG
jgi:hypothetical protein